MRSHALPLPYLSTPSISFLTYLSPLAYLKLLRTAPISPAEAAHLPKLDVSFQHFRKFLTSHPRPHGVTTATLYLSPTAPPAYHADSMSMSALDTRSSSTLVPSAADMEHVFPAAREAQGPQGQQFTWLLDFTEGGKYPRGRDEPVADARDRARGEPVRRDGPLAKRADVAVRLGELGRSLGM